MTAADRTALMVLRAEVAVRLRRDIEAARARIQAATVARRRAESDLQRAEASLAATMRYLTPVDAAANLT
jgi:hypothetical protein